MRKFIISVIGVTAFCIGLGAVVDRAGATFKSDEKALALVRQARLAIGGDQSLAEVRSMVIKGNTSVTFKVGGVSQTEPGETEIAMQLPDKLTKMVKIGRHDGTDGQTMTNRSHDVFIMKKDGAANDASDGNKKVVVKKVDGDGQEVEVEKIITNGEGGEWTSADGKKVIIRKAGEPGTEDVIVRSGDPNAKRIKVEAGAHGDQHRGMRQNELLRTTLSLLLTAPEGIDVRYTFAGEGDVDGTPANIVNAEFAGSNIRLYLSKASSFPVMISYQGHAMPKFLAFKSKDGEQAHVDKVIFNHKVEAPEMAEVQIRFSDYRGVSGVQLPYRWTTSVAGQVTEVFDVTSYEINPANIAERFQKQNVFVRKPKDSN